MVQVLSETNAGVDRNSNARDIRRLASHDLFDEKIVHLLRRIFVTRIILHGAWLALHMHQNHMSAVVGGDDNRVRIVCQRGDVVDYPRAYRKRSLHDVGTAAIDGNDRTVRR